MEFGCTLIIQSADMLQNLLFEIDGFHKVDWLAGVHGIVKLLCPQVYAGTRIYYSDDEKDGEFTYPARLGFVSVSSTDHPRFRRLVIVCRWMPASIYRGGAAITGGFNEEAALRVPKFVVASEGKSPKTLSGQVC